MLVVVCCAWGLVWLFVSSGSGNFRMVCPWGLCGLRSCVRPGARLAGRLGHSLPMAGIVGKKKVEDKEGIPEVAG